MEAKLTEAAVILFFRGLVLRDKARLAVEVNELLEGRLDGDPVILPAPEGAPREMPQVVLGSGDRSYAIQVAESRVSLRACRVADGLEQAQIDVLARDASALLGYFLAREGAQPYRVGAITLHVVPIPTPGPAEWMLSRFIRADCELGKPAGLQLHFLEKRELGGLPSNIWVRVMATEPQDPRHPGLLFHVDCNTLAEAELSLEGEVLAAYLNVTREEVKKHLVSYLGS